MGAAPAHAPVRAVFLDFGGTLVGGSPDIYSVWVPVLARHGLRVERAPWEAANDRVLGRLGPLLYHRVGARPTFWDEVHAATLTELGIPDPRGAIVSDLHDAATSPSVHRPFPEAREVLLALRADGIALHVVSNNTDYLVESIGRLGWSDLFASLTFSQEAGAEKPDPRVFALALRRAGCDPGEAIHVGDSWTADYDGARKAGLRAAWLNRDGRTPPEPTVTVRDLREVRALLDR
jgi:putative hydrolase of the HAD superfamily